MSHSKKYQSSWRCGIFDLCLGSFTILFPLILLENFLYAFCYIFIISTVSSMNAINITKKNTPFSFSASLNSFDDSRNDKFASRKSEIKEFSLIKVVVILACANLVYYILCVLFGAPLFELYTSTLYFSSLMTVLTVYPLLWYFYSSDSLVSVIKIFSDIKFDNFTESHLHSFTVFTLVGAWLGAFPIPLDWDRPWQAWPITCCIGASLGYSAAHFYMGSKLLLNVIKGERKLASSRSV